MGVSLQASTEGPSGARRRKGRRRKPMAEINITPFVDVMLVLLIIFMVAAPMLTTGVPVDLPESHASEMPSTSSTLTVSINPEGKIFIGEEEVPLDALQTKLADKTQANKGSNEPIHVRGDKTTNYGELMLVMGRIAEAGYKVGLETVEEKR
jgi:biopolymer transport protein TolR